MCFHSIQCNFIYLETRKGWEPENNDAILEDVHDMRKTYFHDISNQCQLFLSEITASWIVSSQLQYCHRIFRGLSQIFQHTVEVHASGSWIPVTVVTQIFEPTIAKY
jgi:hypothetical protein